MQDEAATPTTIVADRPTVIERQLAAMLRAVTEERAKKDLATTEADELSADHASTRRVIGALRSEQHVRDGRPIGQMFARLADRLAQDYPA